MRAWLAGAMAAAVGCGVGWGNYFRLPGAMRIDWEAVGPMVFVFGVLCALMMGLGLGGGLHLASRKHGPRTSAVRLAVGAGLGGMILGTLPATLGIGGFAHLNAPYGGTANILGSSLLANAVFVAVFAPMLHADHEVGFLRRLGLAALASCITAATLGGLVWVLVNELGVVPSFPELADTAEQMGLWMFSAGIGAGLTAALGVFVGLATWIYLSLVLAVRRPS